MRQFVHPGLRTWQKHRAAQMLCSRLAENVPVSEIAAACALSTSYFARAFRRSFDIPVHQYRIRLRLEKARKLLVTTRKPLAEIAQLCGFCDQAAFTRAFGKAERMPPSMWRSRNGG